MTDSSGGQRHDRTALILYGTETGNSQDAAEQLGRIAERLRFDSRVCSMDVVKPNDLLNKTIVIFVVSTTGQGDMPADTRQFWKSLLRKRLPPDCLSHVRFTTFGLGDSSYVKFNWAARKLHKRLEQLGAEEFYPRGEADERHEEGTDGAFLPWSYNLKTFLLEKFPLPDGLSPIPDTELVPPKVRLELQGATNHATLSASNTDLEPMSSIQPGDAQTMDSPIRSDRGGLKEAYSQEDKEAIDTILPLPELLPIPYSHEVLVTENTRITAPDHWQDVRHISMICDKVIDYQPGDILEIYPKNFPEDVNALIELQDWIEVADLPLCFEAPEGDYTAANYFPQLISCYHLRRPTLRSLLIHNLDINSIPRRYFFEVLSKFTTDEEHRQRLLDFSNPAYTDEFFDYSTRPRRSCLEVLQDFRTVKLPWRWVLTIFPALRPRQFSISSGGRLKHPFTDQTVFDITVALVKYRTVLRKIRQGVCSRYLSVLPKGTKIAITLRRGAISNVINHRNSFARPILMVAPGTGVAPMRSLIYDRALHRLDVREFKAVAASDHDSLNPSKPFANNKPPMLLIYGGRNQKADFLYESDWKIPALELEVLTAFSRDQREKIYVQDVIKQNADKIWWFLGPQDHGLKNNDSESNKTDGRLRLVKCGQAGTVFVCGSSGNMPESVRRALVHVFMEMGGWEKEVAEKYLVGMEKEGRYVQETW